MGLPASQRRILERIENALRGSDPRLAALFSIFTRLNRDEEMPRAEQVRARAAIIMTRLGYRLASLRRWFGAPGRARVRAAVFFPIAFAIVASAVLVGAGFPSSNRCASAPPAWFHPAPALRSAPGAWRTQRSSAGNRPPARPIAASSGRGVGRLSSVGLAASEMHGRRASSAPRRGAETQPRLA